MTTPYNFCNSRIPQISRIHRSWPPLTVGEWNTPGFPQNNLDGEKKHFFVCLMVGFTIIVGTYFATNNLAHGQELFILFAESGPEVYQVDTVKSPDLSVRQIHSVLWPTQAPRIAVESPWLSSSVGGLINTTLQMGLGRKYLGGRALASDRFDRIPTLDGENPRISIAVDPVRSIAPDES